MWLSIFVVALLCAQGHCQIARCRDLDFCSYRGVCNTELLLCECFRGYSGSTCANPPPPLITNVKVPGGLNGIGEMYYYVPDGSFEVDDTIWLELTNGAVDIVGAIGEVPTREKFQFTSPANKANAVKKSFNVTSTVPLSMQEDSNNPDINLYITVYGTNPDATSDYELWHRPHPPAEGPVPGLSPWAGATIIAFPFLICCGCAWLQYVKAKRGETVRDANRRFILTQMFSGGGGGGGGNGEGGGGWGWGGGWFSSWFGGSDGQQSSSEMVPMDPAMYGNSGASGAYPNQYVDQSASAYMEQGYNEGGGSMVAGGSIAAGGSMMGYHEQGYSSYAEQAGGSAYPNQYMEQGYSASYGGAAGGTIQGGTYSQQQQQPALY